MITNTAKENNHRFQQLDALRGIAAVLVMLFHYTTYSPYRTVRESIFKVGITGVELFFIISGYVIFMSISKTKKGKDFVVNRFSRLYPTYWTCMIVTCALLLFSSVYKHNLSEIPHTLYDFAVNITMVQYYFHVPNLDWSYWTLVIELLFYVIAFTLFKIKQLKNTEIILFVIVLLHLLIHNTCTPSLNNDLSFLLPILNYLPLFLSGIFFYNIQHQKLTIWRVCGLIICYAITLSYFPFDRPFGYFHISFTNYACAVTSYYVLFALINKLGFLVSKPTIFLGRISYALYLIHQYLGRNFIIPTMIQVFHVNLFISVIIAIIVAITVASLITIYVDEPMRYFIRKKFKMMK